MINFGKASAHIRHTLGGELSPDLDLASIMNDAGNFMTAVYPWKWLEATSSAITLADGALTDLDSSAPNFVELIGYSPRGTDSRITSGAVAFLVSPQELQDLRQSTHTIPATTNYFAVVYDSAGGSGLIRPQLDAEVGATAISDLRLRYRKGWAAVSDDTSTFTMPNWMEPVYMQCLRAFARGYEEEDVASLSQRLQDIRNGPLVAAAVERDPRMTTYKRFRTGPQQEWGVPGTHNAGTPRA